MIEVSSYVEQAGNSGDDSLAVVIVGDAIVVCVADGAGGISGGLDASRIVVQAATTAELSSFRTPNKFEEFLRQLDQTVYSDRDAGETTAIIAMIKNSIVLGASLGDSECWLISENSDYELTQLQNRKPLLGCGSASPVGFGPILIDGTLILGSDGLFKYTSLNKIKDCLVMPSVDAKSLINLAKQSTGFLQDDATAVVCK